MNRIERNKFMGHKTKPESILMDMVNKLKDKKVLLWKCRNNTLTIRGQRERVEEMISNLEYKIEEYIREITKNTYPDKEELKQEDMYQ